MKSLKQSNVYLGLNAWINASIDDSGAISAPNKLMKDIISSTMKRIADEPLYIIQTGRKKACYIYHLRTVLYLTPLETENATVKIICRDNLNHIHTSDINDLPCEPLIITKNFLQEKIFPFQTGYLGYNESFYSGLTRGQLIDEPSLNTNLTFCVKQSKSSTKKVMNRLCGINFAKND